MTFSRNRLSSSSGDFGSDVSVLEDRVLLAATELTRAGTGSSGPEDGFANIPSVGDTMIGAANNAWNRGALRGETPLVGTAEEKNGLATVQVTSSPDGPIDSTGAPYGFPTLLVGSANNISSEKNPFTPGRATGVRQDRIESIPITFTSNGGSDVDGTYNQTLDVWFGTRNNGERDIPSAYLMLQNYNSYLAEGRTEGQGRPAGDVIARGQTFDGIDGTYDIWFGPNAGTEEEGGVPVDVVSYVRTDDQDDGAQQTQGDLNALIQDASTRARPGGRSGQTLLNPDLNLDVVYAGIEVWDDAVGAEVGFDLDLNRR